MLQDGQQLAASSCNDLEKQALQTWFNDHRASDRVAKDATHSTKQQKIMLQRAFNAASKEEQSRVVALMRPKGDTHRYTEAVAWAVAFLSNRPC